MTHSECVSTVAAFLHRRYSDENLAHALAHAECGRLAYYSCCCLIGIPTADHPLRGMLYLENGPGRYNHYTKVKAMWNDAHQAEFAYFRLADTDTERRQILIPLIYAEMERRDHERIHAGDAAEVHGGA